MHNACRRATCRARGGRDVYCYFDNDVKVHAPYDAARLAQRLGVPTGLGVDRQFVPPPGLEGPRAKAPAFPGRQRGD